MDRRRGALGPAPLPPSPSSLLPRRKVALVHDYLVDSGGAERTLLELHRLFPAAPIFTSVYDPRTTLPEFRACDVRVSPLQRLARSKRRYKLLLPLYPLAFRMIRVEAFDLVISSTSAFAKAARPRPDAAHLCYCHTPPRFAWNWPAYRREEGLRGPTAAAVAATLPLLRWSDRRAARRVDRFIANSENTRRRIARFYGRHAAVVYPPIDLDRFDADAPPGDYFLVVSRLNPYKRIDLAVEAFTSLGLPLVVVGDGPDRGRLERLAGPSVRFVGRVGEAELRALYAGCRAAVVPGAEDLGMVALEANASGRPVIAFGRGGARETVIPGVTGEWFFEPSADALIDALGRLTATVDDARTMRRHAERFSSAAFRRGIVAEVSAELGDGALGRLGVASDLLSSHRRA